MAKRYKENFKKQIVGLYNNGKSLADLNREYEIAKLTINTWIERYNGSGSFNIDDNRTEEEKELIELRKKLKQWVGTVTATWEWSRGMWIVLQLAARIKGIRIIASGFPIFLYRISMALLSGHKKSRRI